MAASDIIDLTGGEGSDFRPEDGKTSEDRRQVSPKKKRKNEVLPKSRS